MNELAADYLIITYLHVRALSFCLFVLVIYYIIIYIIYIVSYFTTNFNRLHIYIDIDLFYSI